MTKGKGDRMDVILAYDADMPCAASLDAIIDDLDIDDTALALDQMVRTPDNNYRVCGWKNIEWDGSPLCAALSPVLRYSVTAWLRLMRTPGCFIPNTRTDWMIFK